MKGNRGYGRVRRGISVLIALVMVMSLISIQAFANVPMSYYICGTMTDNAIDEDYELTLGDDGYYHYDELQLELTDSFVIVSSFDGKIDEYYPDGAGSNTTIMEMKSRPQAHTV